MLSPLTGLPLDNRQWNWCGKGNPGADWFEIEETDGTRYMASDKFCFYSRNVDIPKDGGEHLLSQARSMQASGRRAAFATVEEERADLGPKEEMQPFELIGVRKRG